jgi:acetyl-CoA acetyltransferase
VYVHSAAQGLPAQHHGMVNYWNDDPLTGPAWTAARHLWKHADFTPDDVDVAQIYDAFTPLIPLSLEGYGFCGRGEGGAYTEGGALEIGGRLPLNTSGGGLSEAYVHGFNLINEGVKQLRGTSTAQVPDAATCLVTAGEGVPTSALLLRT